LEHITARQHGGLTVLENLAWACQRCNERKGPNLTGVDPETSTVVPLFHPRRDRWEDHFALDGLKIIGVTATGRATVPLLGMNRAECLRWRAALRGYGLL
jgi:5-methylcytosine-specific restriction endonuclease McrA